MNGPIADVTLGQFATRSRHFHVWSGASTRQGSASRAAIGPKPLSIEAEDSNTQLPGE
jgi:hypothetical protein